MNIKRKTKTAHLRKGYTLTEMFVMTFLMTILLLLMTRPTKTIINRIPYIQADIQTNRILLSVTDSIRKDLVDATDIEITVTEIPVEIKIVEPAPLVDAGIDPNSPPAPTEPNDLIILPVAAEPNDLNILPVPAEPNEPNGMTEIELITVDSSYYSIVTLIDSNSTTITNDPNIAEVISDANMLVVSIDANDIKMLADVNDVNDIYVEPVDTMTTLLIKTGDKTIRYEFANGIVKRITTPAETNNPDRVSVWHIPKARLDMQVWQDNEKPYALEIATAIVRKINGRTRDTMSNSHVFFVKEQNR